MRSKPTAAKGSHFSGSPGGFRSSWRPVLRAVLGAAALALVGTAALLARQSAPRAADAPPPAGENLVVTAKLVEIPTKFPPDDLYDYADVMRYEIIGGPKDKQSILVAQYKPRQPRSKIGDQMKAHVSGKVRSFKQGDVHKLQLAPNLKTIWKGALVDEFAASDRKSVRYWALVTDPA
ncbi:MAG: hypothetical protein ABUS79_08615 [Pseudomonadota bacterium]